MKTDKRIFIFASHEHFDHFNPEIFQWRTENTTYILSADILEARKARKEDAIFLANSESYQVEYEPNEFLNVRAFGSTDCGVSFLVQADGKKIFHAGDLNNWHWSDESPASESAKYEKAFLNELTAIKEVNIDFDVVMFPVDQRLGRDYMRGARQFVENLNIGLFVPMHFGNSYDKANAFESTAKENKSSFFKITHKGERMEWK